MLIWNIWNKIIVLRGEIEMNPIVSIKMSNGKEIKIELYPEIAPNTVNNFISLVNKGFIMVLYSTE